MNFHSAVRVVLLRITRLGGMAVILVIFLAMVFVLIFDSVDASPAVRIKTDPMDLQRMFYVHAKDNLTMLFTVENRGDVPDTYDVNVTLTHPNFRACLDRNSTGTVPPGGGALINISLWAVPGAVEGDHTTVNITAASTSTGARGSLTFMSFFVITRSVEISAEDTFRSIEVGSTSRFFINATNTGDVNDTYRIGVEVTSGYDGWSTVLSAARLELDPLERAEFFLDVTAPTDAVDNASILVLVTSLASPSVSDSCVVRCLMITHWSASLSTGTTEFDVAPGNLTRVRLVVTQDSDDPRGDDWTVTTTPSNSSWVVDTTPFAFTILRVNETTIDVDVTAPLKTLAGTMATVHVCATCTQFPDKPFGLNLTFHVLESRKLSLVEPPGGFGMVPAGGNGSTVLSIRNDGNIIEECLLVVEMPACVQVIAFIDGEERSSMVLLPWEEVTLELGIEVSEDPCVVGTSLNGSIVVRAQGLELGPIPLMIGIIDERWPLQLDLMDGREWVVSPGERDARKSIRMRNMLNVSLKMDLNATISNPGCQVVLTNSTRHLGAHGETFAEVHLSVGDDAPYGPFWIEVLDSSLSGSPGGSAHSLRIAFKVVGPDLMIIGARVESQVSAGEDVVFLVTVANVGLGQSGRTIVRGHVDGVDGASTEINGDPMDPGENQTVRLTIEALKGNRTYIFEVDPDDLIREDGNGSNSLRFNYEPKNVKSDQDRSQHRTTIVVALVIIIVGVAVIVAGRTRWRHDGEPDRGNGPQQ